MPDERPVYIIDGLNAYLRAYSAFPQMSSHGHQVGGTVGFLKTLNRLAREFQPASFVVTWEGGGSQRRRKIFPDYKMNRKPEKLNRFYEEDIPDSDDNRKHQLIVLLSLLKHLPVCQVYASDCEGDDVVAHLCRGIYRDKEVVIVSSDKDMYQLLGPTTKIYSLYKKRFVTSDDLFDEYRIKSHNFAVAKCLCGDPGDNVPGIKGLGFKTVVKRFPMLGSDETVLVQDVISYAEAHSSESSLYRRVAAAGDEVRRNWQLVHLDGSMLSSNQASKVEHVVNTFVPKINRMDFIRALLKEGINDFDADGLFYSLNCVEGLS